jgi:hypothetical protein
MLKSTCQRLTHTNGSANAGFPEEGTSDVIMPSFMTHISEILPYRFSPAASRCSSTQQNSVAEIKM